MPAGPIQEECSRAPDHVLVRAITMARDNYSEEFRRAAESELATRDIDVAALGHHAVAHLNQEAPAQLEREELTALLGRLEGAWDTVLITTAIGETLVVSAAGDFRVCHVFEPVPGAGEDDQPLASQYGGTLIFDSARALDGAALDFVALSPTWGAGARRSTLAEWTVVAESNDPEGLASLAGVLAQGSVPFTLRSAQQTHFNAIFGTSHSADALKLLVRNSDVDAARQALGRRQQEVEELHDRLQEIEDQANPYEELEILERLATLDPGNPAVFLDRGLLLMDQKRYADARESFVHALQNGDEEVVALVGEQLAALLEHLPQDIPLLHTLASLSLAEGDHEAAHAHYERILNLDPEDAVAHVNLGYYFYQTSESDEAARRHFEAYLGLEPNAPDVAAIRTILAELT